MQGVCTHGVQSGDRGVSQGRSIWFDVDSENRTRPLWRAGGQWCLEVPSVIDVAAHVEACVTGGSTLCVLGSGLLCPTPRAHMPVFHRILKAGAILSPFHDGQRGAGWTYPYRNPWIVALSDCVVVVQAGQNSGALSTGRFALRHSVPVFLLSLV